MRIARAQAAVPWVPSRHRYALFRLVAFLRLTVERPTPVQGEAHEDTVVLAIDRDQSTVEAFAVSLLMWLTVASFIAALLKEHLTLGVAIIAALPLAAVALNASVVIVGLVFPPLLHILGVPRAPSNITLNSMVILIGIALGASYFAMQPDWLRVPAWIFLGALVLNGIAAIAVFLLRHRIRIAESRCAA